MVPPDITSLLQQEFGTTVSQVDATSWQVETQEFRLLVLLSEDQSWLRLLVPIVPVQDAETVLEQLLAANFDQTLETRYATHKGVVWGVFQHSLESLTSKDFLSAASTLIRLSKQGLSSFYDDLIEQRIRQVIQAAKRQGQSIEETMQVLERFYAEGLMGEMEGGTESRDQTLSAWRWQLERLWPEVE
ncbi:MAG: hypothetical protein ACFBSC_07650 [Microcoleaceae cyanobacterium]